MLTDQDTKQTGTSAFRQLIDTVPLVLRRRRKSSAATIVEQEYEHILYAYRDREASGEWITEMLSKAHGKTLKWNAVLHAFKELGVKHGDITDIAKKEGPQQKRTGDLVFVKKLDFQTK